MINYFNRKGDKGNFTEKDLEFFNRARRLHDHNPALQFDDEGRLIRWVKDPLETEVFSKKCCAKIRAGLQKEYLFVKKMDEYQQRMTNDIEAR